MRLSDLTIRPGDGWPAARGAALPLAFVDLAEWDLASCPEALPQGYAAPLVGIGACIAAGTPPPALDAVVESAAAAEVLAENVLRNPNAARVTVQLLRAIEGLDMERALTFESMAYGMLQASAEHRAWLAARQPPAAPLPTGKVHMEREGQRLAITLDRQHAHNAIDRTARDGLYEAFQLAALDPDIERVEFRAEGKAFSIGADLAEFGTTTDPVEAHRIRGLTLPALPLSRCGAQVEVHIQGACIGAGLEMAAFAGRVTAAPNAWFQLPELAMGILPGAGGCVSIPRRIGRHRTAEMLLSGRRVNAKTALEWGLVDEITDEIRG